MTNFSPPPPPPPPPPPGSFGDTSFSGGITLTGQGRKGPPWIPFSLTFAVFLTCFILLFFEGLFFNVFSFVLGSFVGPLGLAWFSAGYNERLSKGILVERMASRFLIRIFTIAAWIVGTIHLYWVAEAISRLVPST